MIKKAIFLSFAICCLLGTTNCIFEPKIPSNKNRAPYKPVIDSVVTGLNSSGEEGLWIHFNLNPLDSLEDIKSFILYRKVRTDSVSDTLSDYKLLYRGIPANLRAVFDDDIDFPTHYNIKIYSYKIAAVDSAYPSSNISDLSDPESLAVCKKAQIIYPEINEKIDQLKEFKCSVWDMGVVYQVFFGVNRKDNTYWSQHVCDPASFIIVGRYKRTISAAEYNQNKSATVKELEPGEYYFWVKIIWNGSVPVSQSINAVKFTIL